MNGQEATERVTRAIFEAIGSVIDRIKEQGDEEGLSKVGPVLLTTGAMVLVRGVGIETTASVIRELAARVERGDFSPKSASSDQEQS
ncbi:MAG: hypothetical protein AB1641_25520 [Thermodesulfobacteriota bacterium]